MKKLNNAKEVMQALIDGKAIRCYIWKAEQWIRLSNDKNMIIDNEEKEFYLNTWSFSSGTWFEIPDPEIPTEEEVVKVINWFKNFCTSKKDCDECGCYKFCPSLATPFSKWKINKMLEIFKKEVK